MARTIGNKLAAVLGQQFVVDNRAGAGGVIGAETAAHAADTAKGHQSINCVAER